MPGLAALATFPDPSTFTARITRGKRLSLQDRPRIEKHTTSTVFRTKTHQGNVKKRLRKSASGLTHGAQWSEPVLATARCLSSSLSLSMLFRLLALALLAAPFSAHAATRSCGSASHYGIGDGYHGQRTANGERFDAYGLTAAHPWLPLGSRVRVTNQRNGRSVTVRINDRGPYAGGHMIDLSYGAFSAIASPGQGVASVCIVSR